MAFTKANPLADQEGDDVGRALKPALIVQEPGHDVCVVNGLAILLDTGVYHITPYHLF